MENDFKLVTARSVHQSSILPPRQHNEDLSKSIRQMGNLVPIIVRPIQGKSEEYEIIDGVGRRQAMKDDEKILVDVRHDVSDLNSFKICDATFSRKERSAYETSLFYDAWLKTLERETGSTEGSQQKLAEQANLSESSLSQYIAIAKMFEKLLEIAPKEQFSKLKTWSINKLYKLSELADDPRLLDLARFFELKFETELEEVVDSVNSYRGTKQTQESPFDQEHDEPEPDRSSMPIEQRFTSPSDELKRIFLRNAKKVGSLAVETSETINTITQELMQDADRLSSTEILQILIKVLHTLRKLKKHSNVLRQKIRPQIREGSQ